MVDFIEKPKNCHIILVEKTDRLYRNFRDAVTLEDMGAEIHFVKENQIISKNSKSQDNSVHGINLVLSRNYIENLREEVKRGDARKGRAGHLSGTRSLWLSKQYD